MFALLRIYSWFVDEIYSKNVNLKPCRLSLVSVLTTSIQNDKLTTLYNFLFHSERRHEKMKVILSSTKSVLSAPPKGEM